MNLHRHGFWKLVTWDPVPSTCWISIILSTTRYCQSLESHQRHHREYGQANAALRVPFLGYTPAGVDVTAFDGISNYNSLQVTVRKQFTHGFLMQASYTYSKDLSDIGAH